MELGEQGLEFLGCQAPLAHFHSPWREKPAQ
jgi:hypothetical protein